MYSENPLEVPFGYLQEFLEETLDQIPESRTKAQPQSLKELLKDSLEKPSEEIPKEIWRNPQKAIRVELPDETFWRNLQQKFLKESYIAFLD